MFDIDFLRCLVSEKLGNEYKLASYYEQINDDSEIDRYIETYKAIINDENNTNNKAWGVIRQEGNSEITNLYYNYVMSFDWSIYFKCKQKDRDSVLIDLNKLIKENKAINFPMIQTSNGTIYNYSSDYYRDIISINDIDTLRNILKYEKDYSNKVVLRVPTTDKDGHNTYEYFDTLSSEEKDTYIKQLFNDNLGYYKDGSSIIGFNFNTIKDSLKNCLILISDIDNSISYEYKVLEPKNVGKCIKIVDYNKSLYSMCGDYNLYKINLAFNSIESTMPKVLNGDEICDIYLSGTSTLADSTVYMGTDLYDEKIVFNSGTKAYSNRIETLDLSDNGSLDYETNRTRASGYSQDLFITAKSNQKKLSILVNYNNDSIMYFYKKFTSMKYENENVNVSYIQYFKRFDDNYTYITNFIGKIIGGEVSNTNGDIELLTLTLQVRS